MSRRVYRLWTQATVALAIAGVASLASAAQPDHEEEDQDAATRSADPDSPAPAAAPPDPQPAAPDPEPEPEPDEDVDYVDDVADEPGGLRIHIVSTRGTYLPLEFDVFSVATRGVVASGRGALEARGEIAETFTLEPGLYRIVKSGEPFATRADFATAIVEEGYVTDFVIVVDHESGHFRGSGPITDELPEGLEIVGINLSLSGGGTLMLNQKLNPVGGTPGTTAVVGLFGNFGLVFDRNNHFLDVSSSLQLNVTDPARASPFSTSDLFEGSATYTYKINNPYIGPYGRASFRTHVFPGYLYLESADSPSVTVNFQRADGTTQTRTFGNLANQDDLRVQVSKAFAPLILQEEIGANLKAVDLDLFLLKLVVGTRIGFGLRQAFTNDLLVPVGPTTGSTITLREIEDYQTLGPVVGASGKVTVARWLFGSADFGMMVPVKDPGDFFDQRTFAQRLLFDFAGTAGFKVPVLTQLLYASFDYTFRLERDAFITNRTQFDHSLMGRVNVTLF